jgi:Family of unknown function (DUF5684)
MKVCSSPLSLLGLSLVGVLTFAGMASAQSDDAASMAIASAFFLFMLAVGAAFYIYFALALQTIAKKTATENGWLAWIPIANIILMVQVAKKPLWWFVLFLIPLVNIVVAVIVWMAIAEARHKPNWLGILTIVPVANLVVPGYLAWAD